MTRLASLVLALASVTLAPRLYAGSCSTTTVDCSSSLQTLPSSLRSCTNSSGTTASVMRQCASDGTACSPEQYKIDGGSAMSESSARSQCSSSTSSTTPPTSGPTSGRVTFNRGGTGTTNSNLPQTPSSRRGGSATPLVLDLGTPIAFAAKSVRFDVDDEGMTREIGWVSGKNGFLALDADGDGAIRGGAELFGSGTRMDKGHAADGFAALALQDANHDGVIDEQDPVFAKLVVWQDANEDAVSTPDELAPLSRYGITSIELAHMQVGLPDRARSLVVLVGKYHRRDAHGVDTTGVLADVFFQQIFPAHNVANQ